MSFSLSTGMMFWGFSDWDSHLPQQTKFTQKTQQKPIIGYHIFEKFILILATWSCNWYLWGQTYHPPSPSNRFGDHMCNITISIRNINLVMLFWYLMLYMTQSGQTWHQFCHFILILSVVRDTKRNNLTSILSFYSDILCYTWHLVTKLDTK